MDQDRIKDQSDRSRTDSEPAEGSREDVRGSGSSSERNLGGGSGLQSGTNKGAEISNRDRNREDSDRDTLLDDESDSER